MFKLGYFFLYFILRQPDFDEEHFLLYFTGQMAPLMYFYLCILPAL